MSQGGHLQEAWHRRRRRLGDSIPGCLLFIALVIGGTMWAYFKFVHWQPITKAGTGYVTFEHKKNTPAYLEYGRRMRTGFAFQVRAMVGQNATLIRKFKKGEFKDKKSEFDTETADFANQLLDSITQFDGQQVPKVLVGAHNKIALCHKYCYESLRTLQDAYGAEGAERARLLTASEKKMKEAWKTGDSGVKEFFQVWSKTST